MPRLQSSRFRQHGEPLEFVMDGERCMAVAGETIAAALIASGRISFKRDKQGRPRGPLCGMGVCFECEVSVDGVPARACLTKVRAGMQLRSLDYRVDCAASVSAAVVTHEAIACDVLVVGAGPAGMSAAAELAAAGMAVTVVDERPEPGGQFFKPLGASHRFAGERPTDAQYREGAELSRRLASSTARIISGATVWGAFGTPEGGFECSVAAAEQHYVVTAQHLVLAAGAFESVPAVPGWTLPGVMTTGAAQGLARAYRVGPGAQVLIAGNGPLNLQLACELLEGGIKVVAVAESAPNPASGRFLSGLGLVGSAPALALRGARYLWTLRRRGVPVLFGHHIARAQGDSRVSEAVLAAIGADGRLLAGTERSYAVDAVCLGYGLQASNELARALGCKHTAIAPGVTVPVRDDDGQTDIAGVFVVGDGGVLGGAHVALAEGRIAAGAILRGRGAVAGADRQRLRRHRRFQRHLWSLYQAPEYVPATPEVLICRCETVTLATVDALIDEGVTDFASLKRRSRVGMGSCQGRYCQRQLARVIAQRTGVMPPAEQLFEARLPVKPTLLSVVAAEQPEWAGYRTVELQRAAKAVAGPTSGPQLEADVLVIGAGVIGLSTAMHLAQAGLDVVVMDSGTPCAQASGGNAGSLHLQMLSSDFGNQSVDIRHAAHALALQRLGIAEWQALEARLGAAFEIDMTGGLVVAEREQELEFLRRKVALEQGCGVDVELLGQAELRRLFPAVSPQMIGAAYCPGEGKINPLLAAPVLVQATQAAGARLLTACAVTAIDFQRGRYTVSASAATLRCRQVVNAAGGWAADVATLVGVTLPVRTAPQQMIVTEPLQPMVAMLVAAAQRHLTLKQAANGNVIIGGGWPAGFDPKRRRALNLRTSIEGNLWIAQHVIPALGGARMLRSWATVGVMIDGAPILGELPGQPGFFNAVGANGYTMGPILGRITAGLITGSELPLDVRPFSVDRFQ